MHHEDVELVDLIYGAMLGEKPWEEFVNGLARMSPEGCALMFAYDRRRGNPAVTILEGRSSDTKDSLELHYGVLNPYAPYCMVKPLGQGVVGDRMISRERLVRTEFYNDFMLKNDTTSTVGIAIDRSEEFTILISTATRLNDEDEQRRLAAQYSRLAPHLMRAAAFYRRNVPSRMATALGGSLYDAADVGTLLVTPALRLISMSDAAQRLLGPCLRFDQTGRVRLPGEAPQAALQLMSGSRYNGPQTQTFTVGELRLTLVKISRGGVIDLFDDCGVAVLVRATSHEADGTSYHAIQKSYGLTTAEMRVLQHLLRGLSSMDIANLLGRSRETIRSQTKAICMKTNTRGQTQLMATFSTPHIL